jgi:hypothetical protein
MGESAAEHSCSKDYSLSFKRRSYDNLAPVRVIFSMVYVMTVTGTGLGRGGGNCPNALDFVSVRLNTYAVVGDGLPRTVYDKLLLSKDDTLRSINDQAPTVFQTLAAAHAYALLAVEALLKAANARVDGAGVSSLLCGPVHIDADLHGVHVASAVMTKLAAKAYRPVVLEAVTNFLGGQSPGRQWWNDGVGLPPGALYYKPNQEGVDDGFDRKHAACDQIAIDEVAEHRICELTDGKVGHDIARVLMSRDDLPAGNQTIAGGVGPKSWCPIVGQVTTANCGGMTVLFTLQGDMDVIFIPALKDAKYVLL